MLRTGRSLKAHTSAASSGTRVVPTCPEPHQSQSPWTFRRWQLSRRKQLSQRATEQEEQPEEEEEEEYEETITLRASDFVAFQDILKDMRSQITDLQRNARQDRLETHDMLRAILDRLPPAFGSSAPPAP
jgi:hypothetical protein